MFYICDIFQMRFFSCTIVYLKHPVAYCCNKKIVFWNKTRGVGWVGEGCVCVGGGGVGGGGGVEGGGGGVCAPSKSALGTRSNPWWPHQMGTFSALLVICAGNSPVPGEFPAQRPVTRSFDVFFDLRLNKRLSKQSRGWWFETPSPPLWRHHNDRVLNMFLDRIYSYSRVPKW